MQRRIVKLGGSLLELPDLGARVMRWLDAHPFPRTLIVVGGGPLIDAVRELDAVHHFPQSLAHWCCVEMLQQTAQLVHTLLPELPLLSTSSELRDFLISDVSPSFATPASTAIVQVAAFYGPTTQGCSIPESWDTTADSIAAELARQTGAQELVLFKSTQPAVGQAHKPERWVEAGIVDRAFSQAARGIPRVRIANLRNIRHATH